MNLHLRVVTLGQTLAFVLMLTGASASAAGFDCRHQGEGAEPALVCTDDTSGSGDSVAWVGIRKMPRWGIHAGLTVVDICLAQRDEFSKQATDDDVQVVFDPAVKLPMPSVRRLCERRYCTDVRKSHSLFINSVPIPVGWAAVGFWIGIQKQSFSISCDSLLPELSNQ